ncbi:hypothetical protein [Streptomyces sp. 150FB]|uniref:hypothetical protein n=1 Tax=Streptomyces sp. 150FB TaxID=1576605 RepID=UPI000B259297|nr:hypothetical protein [Streptomyces sp. 150FB]
MSAVTTSPERQRDEVLAAAEAVGGHVLRFSGSARAVVDERCQDVDQAGDRRVGGERAEGGRREAD